MDSKGEFVAFAVEATGTEDIVVRERLAGCGYTSECLYDRFPVAAVGWCKSNSCVIWRVIRCRLNSVIKAVKQ